MTKFNHLVVASLPVLSKIDSVTMFFNDFELYIHDISIHDRRTWSLSIIFGVIWSALLIILAWCSTHLSYFETPIDGFTNKNSSPIFNERTSLVQMTLSALLYITFLFEVRLFDCWHYSCFEMPQKSEVHRHYASFYVCNIW